VENDAIRLLYLYEKNFGRMDFGFERRRVGIAFADGPYDLGVSFWIKASMIGAGEPLPFRIIPWNFPCN
jgi:hypothetical protein